MDKTLKLWKAINNLSVRVVYLRVRVERLEDLLKEKEDRAVQRLVNVRLP